ALCLWARRSAPVERGIMRLAHSAFIALLVSSVVYACGSSENERRPHRVDAGDEDGGLSSGGRTGSGGAKATGGTKASGGTVATGGALPDSGGSPPASGGSSASGGAVAEAGTD